MTYGQLGVIAGLQGDYETSGKWLIRCITAFAMCQDSHEAQRNISNFNIFYQQASPEIQSRLESM